MKVTWHPRFTAHYVSQDNLILLSETEVYRLCGDQYNSVFEFVRKGFSLNSLLQNKHTPLDSCLLIVNELVSQKLAVFVDEIDAGVYSEQGNKYFLPQIDKKVQSIEFNDRVLTNLSNYRDEKNIKNLLKSSEYDLVLVDDYLDPRINRINKQYYSRAQSYLMAKLTGKKLFIGPFFDFSKNKDKDGPCWRCLSLRMRQNLPMREWVYRRNGIELLTPIEYCSANINRNYALAIDKLNSGNIDQFSNCLVELDTGVIHAVTRHGACNVCRIDKNKQRRDAANCFDIERSKKTNLKELSQFISPVSGALASLEPVEFGAQRHEKLYKSVYFRCPQSLDDNDFDPMIGVSLGKGDTADQSAFTAICEGLERVSTQWQGDEQTIFAEASQLSLPYFAPSELAPYSQRQFKIFETELNQQSSSAVSRQAVRPWLRNTGIHWSKAHNLSRDEVCYLPSVFCYSDTPLSDQQFCRWNSNGCAAGDSLLDATMRGLFEVIERDAVAIWWYNKIQVPALDTRIFDNSKLINKIESLSRVWELQLLDLTNDFEVPVVAAIAFNKINAQIRFGFGCDLDVQDASFKSLQELQQLISLEQSKNGSFDFENLSKEPYLRAKHRGALPVAIMTDYGALNSKEKLHICMDKLHKAGKELIVFDYDRADYPVSTVKVVVPGACHFWPELANSRLYDIPLELNWRTKRLTEEELNPVPLFI